MSAQDEYPLRLARTYMRKAANSEHGDGRASIETKVEINAPASRVWAVLTDFARYPAWSPFITAIAGKPAAGERLSITIRPPGKSAITMRPTLVAVTPERELRWLGHLIVSGFFDG